MDHLRGDAGARTWDDVRALYPGASTEVYLDSAAVGLISTRVHTAMADLLATHRDGGIAAVGAWREHSTDVRAAAARLVGGRPDAVSFTQNTSTGLALVTNGLRWAPGDNVLLPAGEFPSNSYPWRQLRQLGVEVREVPARHGGAHIAEAESLVDSRTRVIALSAVQYSSGHRYDLAPFAQLARSVDALLVVDATQALGAVTVDVSCGIDVLAVSSHKWILGPAGIGFVHLSDTARDRLRPTTVGWLSVADPFAFTTEPDLASDGRRFESGTENSAGIAGLGATLGLLHQLGPSTIVARVLDHAAHLAELLRTAGLHVHRSDDPDRVSGIVIASSPGANHAHLHQQLLADGVRCSLRAAGIRFAPHYFNHHGDLSAAIDSLRAAVRHHAT